MKKSSVIFALKSYLPYTYTWIFNQLKFLKNVHVLILTETTNSAREHFPLGQHTLFAFPGLSVSNAPNFWTRLIRQILRIVLVYSRIDVLVFAFRAQRYKPSLIHAHFADTGWKFISLAQMVRIPLIVSFYGYDYDFLLTRHPKWKSRYKELFKKADLFLTEGRIGRENLIKKGVNPQKVKVHHLGVDVNNILFRIRKVEDGESLRLIQVASFVEKKGHQVLIKAIRLLKDQNMIDRVSLTFIGEGSLKGDIIDLVRRCELTEYITFKDHISYATLHEELLNYHVFVQPSLTADDGNCEGGAPVVLLDAQATGMPALSTYHCDIPEVVKDGVTGFLVAEKDHAAMADRIVEFLKFPNLLSEQGSQARKYVEENYSAKRQAQKLEEIYSELTRK